MVRLHVDAEEKLHCPGPDGHINNELKVNTAACFSLFPTPPRDFEWRQHKECARRKQLDNNWGWGVMIKYMVAKFIIGTHVFH